MPVLFSYAFRPLFLLTTLFAIVAIPYWAAAWLGFVALPKAFGNPIWWHAHEMLFGFGGAAIGGFALTAVANWTKRPPVAGAPLILLSLCWLLARLLPWFESAPLGVIAALDLGYFTLLTLLFARQIYAARNQRNRKLVYLLAGLTLTDLLFFLSIQSAPQWVDTTLMAALWLIVGVLLVITGRVIPAFTGNWLRMQAKLRGESVTPPPPFGRLDLAANLVTALFAIWTLLPLPALLSAATGFTAALLQTARWWRWQGYKTFADPLVAILHIAFAWLPIGLALFALSELLLLPRSAATHALTTGLMASMIMAMASRAALGHTNRPLTSPPVLSAAFVLITITAALRVIAAAVPAMHAWLDVASILWVIAFVLFAWRYLPILLGPPIKDELPLMR